MGLVLYVTNILSITTCLPTCNPAHVPDRRRRLLHWNGVLEIKTLNPYKIHVKRFHSYFLFWLPPFFNFHHPSSSGGREGERGGFSNFLKARNTKHDIRNDKLFHRMDGMGNISKKKRKSIAAATVSSFFSFVACYFPLRCSMVACHIIPHYTYTCIYSHCLSVRPSVFKSFEQDVVVACTIINCQNSLG